MILLSIKDLHKKSSKGNLKAYRLRHYFENLYHGLADILEHSDLETYEQKKEIASELIQCISAIGWLRMIDDFADIQ